MDILQDSEGGGGGCPFCRWRLSIPSENICEYITTPCTADTWTQNFWKICWVSIILLQGWNQGYWADRGGSFRPSETYHCRATPEPAAERKLRWYTPLVVKLGRLDVRWRCWWKKITVGQLQSQQQNGSSGEEKNKSWKQFWLLLWYTPLVVKLDPLDEDGDECWWKKIALGPLHIHWQQWKKWHKNGHFMEMDIDIWGWVQIINFPMEVALIKN